MKSLIRGGVSFALTFCLGWMAFQLQVSAQIKNKDSPPKSFVGSSVQGMMFDGTDDSAEIVSNFLLDNKMADEVTYNPKIQSLEFEFKNTVSKPFPKGTWILLFSDVEKKQVLVVSPRS